MSNIMYMEAHDPEIHATRRFQVLTNAGPRARAREQIKIALENKVCFLFPTLYTRLLERRASSIRIYLLMYNSITHTTLLEIIRTLTRKTTRL